MTTRQIRVHCELGADPERLLERAMLQQNLTARAHDRILKVARTIADLEAAEHLAVSHLVEPIQYRRLDRGDCACETQGTWNRDQGRFDARRLQADSSSRTSHSGPPKSTHSRVEGRPLSSQTPDP